MKAFLVVPVHNLDGTQTQYSKLDLLISDRMAMEVKGGFAFPIFLKILLYIFVYINIKYIKLAPQLKLLVKCSNILTYIKYSSKIGPSN